MDDSQSTAFQQQPQQQQFHQQHFDLEMMKRSMDSIGGPDAIKKARWSPTSFPAQQQGHNPLARQPSFDNYGYPTFSPAQSGPGQPQLQQLFAQQQQQQQAGQNLALNTNQMPNLNGPPSAASPGGGFPNVPAPGQNGAPPSPFLQNGAFGQMPNFAAAAAAYGMGGLMGMPQLGGMAMLGGYGFGPQAFQQGAGRGLPALNITAAQGVYNPAAAAAAAAQANNATGRTVYVGNLPADASVDELLNLVHFGPLESVRILPEKSCVFLSFLDGATAAAFHADATVKKLALHGQELKIGWGKPSPVPSQVLLSISQSNASRNVYLGGLDEATSEEQLRDDLSRFGLIDQVKIVRDKNIGFVHFLSIATATKVVATLPTEPAWAGKRVNYGKDRCAYIPKSQQAAAAAAQVAAAQSLVAQSAAAAAGLQSAALQSMLPPTPLSAAFYGAGAGDPGTPASAAMLAGMAAAGAQGLNRTVYLGNIHPETSTEDLCNAIRGGVLQSIRYMQDKHIAFVTFVDPAAAFAFFQVSTYQGLTLNNRRLKVGWGKNSGPLAPALALAVHGGATRNVYVGNIDDWDAFTEDRLRRDFGEFGDIELVNFLKEKNCAFVNFTNISNAIKAIESVKARPEYSGLRIAHGKDRCANPPRAGGAQSAGGPRRSMTMGPLVAVNGDDGPPSAISEPALAYNLPTIAVVKDEEEAGEIKLEEDDGDDALAMEA